MIRRLFVLFLLGVFGYLMKFGATPPDLNGLKIPFMNASGSTASAKSVNVECPHCRAQNQPDAILCRSCSSKLPMPAATQSSNHNRVSVESTDPQKIATIGFNGESVNLDTHAVLGAVTLFDFYADWCGPCKRLTPLLEVYVKNTPNVYLRKINIANWNTPVTKRYDIRSIPSVWVYGRDRNLINRGLNDISTIKKVTEKELKSH